MPSCFVIMPISTPTELVQVYGADTDHFNHVLEHLFVPAITKIGFEPIPPASTGSDVIQGHIIQQLASSDLVLCDISSLNANVFFELGVRTSLNMPAAIIRDTHTKNIPFDTGIINHHTYDPSLSPWMLTKEIDRLSEHLLAVVNGAKGQNSLWKYFGASTQALTPSATSTLDDKIEYIVQALDRLRSSSPGTLSVESIELSEAEAFLQAAAAIARTVSAQFEYEKQDDDKFVLDFDEFLITPEIQKRIIALGESFDLEVVITSNWIKRGHGVDGPPEPPISKKKPSK